MTVRVTPASSAEIEPWAAMRAALWPDAGIEALRAEALAWDASRGIALLAFEHEGRAIGMAEASLRHDYVNGTASSPVGFLEAWYVQAGHRGHGVGRALIAAVEAWTRDHGCSELASDALLENIGSHAAHAACGFEETGRVVFFRKVLWT